MAKRKAAASESERPLIPSSSSLGEEVTQVLSISSGAGPPGEREISAAQRAIDVKRETLAADLERNQREREYRIRRLGYDPLENPERLLERLRDKGVGEAEIEKLRRAWKR